MTKVDLGLLTVSDHTDVTAIIVNRRTLHLTPRCVRSLLQIYPSVRVVLVDNYSQDRSTRYVRLAAVLCDRIHSVLTDYTTHGAGLSAGIRACTTPYFLTLDSDVTILTGGWLELMLARFVDNPRLFAIGNISLVDGSGIRPGKRRIIHPFCALWDRRKYLALDARFEASGQPARGICFAAVEAGYELEELEGLQIRGAGEYVHHAVGGTRVHLAWESLQR